MNEFSQPSASELEIAIANREALLCNGPKAIEFWQGFASRDDNTGKLLIDTKLITPEIAKEYAEAFIKLENTGLQEKRMLDATGLSRQEIGHCALLLSTLAEIV